MAGRATRGSVVRGSVRSLRGLCAPMSLMAPMMKIPPEGAVAAEDGAFPILSHVF